MIEYQTKLAMASFLITLASKLLLIVAALAAVGVAYNIYDLHRLQKPNQPPCLSLWFVTIPAALIGAAGSGWCGIDDEVDTMLAAVVAIVIAFIAAWYHAERSSPRV